MAKKGETAAAKNDELDKALKQYRDSYEYQRDNWHERWDRDNKLYDSERAIVSYQGTTDTFIPLPYTTIETMVAALNNAEIRIDFASGDPTKRPDAAPLNAIIDEWAEEDGWDLNSEESYREMFKVGMDGNMLVWKGDRPHEITFAMRDAIIDPTVIHPSELQEPEHYAGRRYLVKKGSLDDEKIVDSDPDSKTYGEMVKRYSFKGSEGAGKGQELTDRDKKEMISGSTLKTSASDQDEIIEIWTVDEVKTIKNRGMIDIAVNPFKLRHEYLLKQRYMDEALENVDIEADDAEAQLEVSMKDAEKRAKQDAKGVVPFYFYRNVRKKSLFYATSEIQPIAKEVERLNDLTDMETDYLMKQTAGQRELDPDYEDWIDLIDEDPGTVYPFKPGSLQNIALPILSSNAFSNRQEIKGTIRETTAVSEVANGTISEKDRTKYEISSALSQTGARIESKARVLKADALYWKYWILLRLTQLYVTKPQVVYAPEAKVDRDEIGRKYNVELPVGSAIFDPADFDGDFTPRITLEVDARSKEAESRREARENYMILIQDPTNNLPEVKKRLYPKMFNLDKEAIDAITAPQADPMMGGMGGMTAPGAPVTPAPDAALSEEVVGV